MNRIRRIWTRPFVVFSFLMLLKMYLSWIVVFGYTEIVMPFAAGLPSVWVVFCLIEWLAKKRKLTYYMIFNVVITSIYFAVIMYYKYFGIIVDYRALQQAGQVTEVKGSVMDLLHPYFLLIYVDFVVFLFVFLFSKKSRSWGMPKVNVSRRAVAILLTISLLMCLIDIWNNKGIINEKKKAEEMGILNYEVYSVLSGLKVEPPLDPATITPESVRQLKRSSGSQEQTAAMQQKRLYGAAKGKNVIVIQLEAFQNFLLGLSIDGHEVTPVLNGLKQNSLYMPYIYQQVGQGNTSDAEFMLNTSLYIPPNGAAAQTYADKDLPSLPKLLKEDGYRTVTFHTNDATFWNRKELYASIGFDKYYDHPFFGDDDIVHFGASDEVLYERTAAEMARLQQSGQPFYANVISMSSHHPFNLPERKDKIVLPDEYKGTLVGDYIRSQSYTDYALGQFFNALKTNGLWDNSVIVIYGDHMGLPIYSLSDKEKGLMKGILGRDYGYRDMLNIPLLIHVPGAEPAVMNGIGGHVDFMPTIANLVGLSLDDKQFTYFGNDLLNEGNNILPERYYLPSGSFINDEVIFIPGKSFEDGEMFSLGKTQNERIPSEYEEDFDRALQLLQMSDSYVSGLPKRK